MGISSTYPRLLQALSSLAVDTPWLDPVHVVLVSLVSSAGVATMSPCSVRGWGWCGWTEVRQEGSWGH